MPSQSMNDPKQLLDAQKQMQARLDELKARTFDAPLPLPVYDLYWIEKELFLDIELGGVLPENVQVALQEGRLQLNGNRLMPDESGREYVIQQRVKGHFEYHIPLPEDLKPSSLETRWSTGVLHLKITPES